MKLGNKILKLRKQKGLSQEELGEKVDVTRQTISNWELGETQPNPEQLKLLSKELNVSIDELLDNDIQNVLVEKVSNTEKLAGIILKILKIIIIGIPLTFVLLILFSILYKNIVRSNSDSRDIEETIHCKLYGEEHSLTINYDESTAIPKEIGPESYFYDILDLGKYNDAHQIFNIINDYVKKNGGSCSRFIGKEVNDIINIYAKEATNKGVTVVIEMKNDYNITFGEAFYIEKYDAKNGNYSKVDEKSDCVFNDIGYSLSKGQKKELEQNWSYCLGELPSGTYRIVKDVYYDSDLPVEEDDIYYMWTEFTID